VNRRISEIGFVLCAALVIPVSAREEYTRNFDQSQAVRAGQGVRIEHKLGDVVVRTQPKAEVAVHAVIRCSASDISEAKWYAESIRIALQPSSTGLLVETQYPKQDTDGFLGGRNISYSVSLEVTIPDTAPLELRNSFGAVTVTDLKADGDIATSHGKLLFRNGRGSQRLENSFAAVEVTGNNGDVGLATTNGTVDVADIAGTVTIKNRFGKVTVSRVKGNITVENGNGAVDASGITGSAVLNTSFAAVRFNDIGGQLSVRAVNSSVKGAKAGNFASIENSFAPVEISDVRKALKVISRNSSVTTSDIGEDLNVKASFGPVHADRVGGAVDIENQNGTVDVSLAARQSCRPVNVKTSFAAIRIGVPDNASYAVVARTSFGQIHSDFPVLVQGAMAGDSLSGKIGGGGCTMQLRTQNGGIQIVRNRP
jgi:DUF4097 and DUF4098 domain-containing protein YvlB